jgi:pimeloyl-ACP methyl ester carboxylesterase
MNAPSDPAKRSVELETGAASYTDEGEGTPIVAVHGLPGSARDFRWLAPELSPHARFVRVDLPGFGQTPVSTEPDPSPLGRARFVASVVRALELDRPLLLGHSMGAVVGSAAAEQEPDLFRALALISSPGVRPHTALRRIPAKSVHRLLSRKYVGPALAPLLRWTFARGGFRGHRDDELYRTIECVAATSIPEHAARVRRLSLPTLVSWCDDDPLIEADIAREFADTCPPGPRLHFEEGGHNPQKTHAAELAERLVAWLDALDRAR